jgi:hypothetical protein
MAIVKGILVNDGGAPARIINFTAAAAISAGEALKIDSAGEVALATSSDLPIAGYALTDAALGDMCSVITGMGVVLYAMTTVVARGNILSVGSTAGALDAATDAAADHNVVAYALEANTVSSTLTKVLVV